MKLIEGALKEAVLNKAQRDDNNRQLLTQEIILDGLITYNWFPLEVGFFVRVHDTSRQIKILRIEMENYPIIMTMGM
jgi:hypothetical protein